MTTPSLVEGTNLTMARIPGVDPSQVDRNLARVFEAQEKKWGAPLVNHLIYARRPTIFRGAQAMWAGLGGSGKLDPKLSYIVNRRVAYLNGCDF